MSEQKEIDQEKMKPVSTPEQAIRTMFEMCAKIDITDLIRGAKPTLEYAKGFEIELQRIYQLAMSGLAKEGSSTKMTEKIQEAEIVPETTENNK